MDDSGAANVFVGLVHLHQQGNVGRRVFACKGRRRAPVALDQWNLGQPVALPARHQTCHLRPAVATGVLQVPEKYPAFALAAPGVVKPLEHPADMPIPLAVAAARRKLNRRAGTEKLLDLLNRAKPLFVHVDHHPQNDQPTPPLPSASGSFLVGNTPRVQAHTTLDKAVALRNSAPLLQSAPPGEVDERFKSHAWKACLG